MVFKEIVFIITEMEKYLITETFETAFDDDLESIYGVILGLAIDMVFEKYSWRKELRQWLSQGWLCYYVSNCNKQKCQFSKVIFRRWWNLWNHYSSLPRLMGSRLEKCWSKWCYCFNFGTNASTWENQRKICLYFSF